MGAPVVQGIRIRRRPGWVGDQAGRLVAAEAEGLAELAGRPGRAAWYGGARRAPGGTGASSPPCPFGVEAGQGNWAVLTVGGAILAGEVFVEARNQS